MIKHYFEFRTSGRGMKEIGEPEGFDAAAFTIEQRLHGRDVAFADAPFKIYAKSDLYYAFEYIQYELKVYGYNADIRYHCSFNDEFIQIGELDSGETLSTNEYDYYSFNIVEENLYTLIKKRFDMEYDILSDKTVDNEYISPAPTNKILLYSHPSTVVSKWINPIIAQETYHDNPAQNADYFNVIKQVSESEIKNTLSWLDDSNTDNEGAFKNFFHINALDKLSNIRIQMNYNIRYDYLPTRNNNLDGHAGQVLLRVYTGQSEQDGQYTQYNVWSSTAFTGNTNQTQNLPTSLTLEIPFLDRTDNIWISFVSATNNGAVNRLTFNECETIITAQATGYNSIIRGVRFYDAMKQCAKGIANNDITAPHWEMGGEFYNNFFTTQNLMRNKSDKPFYLSNKFISEKYLPEPNGDYEVKKDGKIFYGIEKDYYQNNEIASFEHAAADGFEKVVNPDFYCNQVTIKFDSYQSQKEIEQENSGDIVHGEAQWSYTGKKAQNTKEVNIGIIRDPLLIEVMRRKAVEIDKDTVTQDDKKVVGLDCLPNTLVRGFTERALLKHTRIDDNTLVLNSVVISSAEQGNETLNSGDPNFLVLGIEIGSLMSIINTGQNEGIFTVIDVQGSEIRLVKTASGATLQNNDGINTTFTYQISNVSVPYIIRTTEGLGTIENINAANRSANLNFSVKNIALRYYNEFNATNLLFSEDKTIRNRVYYNNPDAVINGVREGDDFTATNPILTPYILKTTIFCTLAQWKQLEETLRTNRGYIRIFDANGLPARGYFKTGKWTPETAKPKRNSGFYGKAEIELAEKYFPEKLTVVSDTGTILINNTIMPSSFTYKVNDISGKLSIFDAVGKRLNVPVIYKEVTINGVVPNSIQQLKDLMDGLY